MDLSGIRGHQPLEQAAEGAEAEETQETVVTEVCMAAGGAEQKAQAEPDARELSSSPTSNQPRPVREFCACMAFDSMACASCSSPLLRESCLSCRDCRQHLLRIYCHLAHWFETNVIWLWHRHLIEPVLSSQLQ